MPDAAPPRVAEEARRDFLGRFFHDLAAAMSGVSLQLEVVGRRMARGADPSEAVAEAQSAASRMLDLFEKGRDLMMEIPGAPEEFDFDAWVDGAAQEFGVPVDGTTGGRLLGDPARLRRALDALLTNALEASAGAGDVRLHRERRGDRLAVSVKNDGDLPTEDADRLFFPRSAREGRPWGFGLPGARLRAGEASGRVALGQESGRVVATLDFPERTP